MSILKAELYIHNTTHTTLGMRGSENKKETVSNSRGVGGFIPSLNQPMQRKLWKFVMCYSTGVNMCIYVCKVLLPSCSSECRTSVELRFSCSGSLQGVLIGPCRQVIRSGGMCSHSDANDEDTSHPSPQ